MNVILNRAINSAFWKLLLFGSNFGLNIVLAKTYGAAGSAPIFFWLNNMALAALLLGFGLENSIVYFYSKQLTSSKNLLLTALGWSIGTTLLFVGINTIIPIFHPNIEGLNAWYSYAYIFGALLTNLVSAFFYAEHRNKFPNLIPGLLNCCFLMLLFFLVPQQTKTLSYQYIKVLFLLPLLSGITLFFLQLYQTSPNTSKQLFPVRRFLVYSFNVYLAALCLSVFNRVDILLVERQCSSVQLGNYIQTNKFGQIAMLVPLMASFSLFPSFVQNMENKQVIGKTVYNVANIYFYLVTLFCIAANLISSWALPWIYGQTFNMMPTLLLLLSPGIIAFATVYPIITFFGAANNNLLIARITAESTLLLLLLDFILIPTFETKGAAIGYSIANLFFGFRSLFAFQKFFPFSFFQVFAPRSFILNFKMLISLKPLP